MYYLHLLNKRGWNRECDLIGIDLLIEFLKAHKDKILEIWVEHEDLEEIETYVVNATNGEELAVSNTVTWTTLDEKVPEVPCTMFIPGIPNINGSCIGDGRKQCEDCERYTVGCRL